MWGIWRERKRVSDRQIEFNGIVMEKSPVKDTTPTYTRFFLFPN